MQKIMKLSWPQTDPVVSAVAQMVRKTDDRTRDITPETVEAVVKWLKKFRAGKDVVAMVEKQVAIESREQNQIYGERLPHGLILKLEDEV